MLFSIRLFGKCCSREFVFVNRELTNVVLANVVFVSLVLANVELANVV